MRNRRELLSAVGGVTVVGLAGCTGDSSEPDPEPESDQSEQPATDSDSETEDGLQLDFTAKDMWEKETQYYESSAKHHGINENAAEIADQSHIENADLTNYNEFQTALVRTLNEVVHYLGEQTTSDSSVMTSEGAAATNLILQQELEENYDSFDAIMLSHGSSGHGYTLNLSTDHELTMADSNTDNVGPAKERPLQDRRNSNASDPIAQFSEDKIIGDDYRSLRNRITYQSFTDSIYANRGDGRKKVRVELDKLSDFYNEAILTESGELHLGPVRDTMATLINMHEHNHFQDQEYTAITSTPSELPTLEQYETLDEYAEELTDNHIEIFDSEDEYEEATMAPDGYNP